jgi:hypothetical protein
MHGSYRMKFMDEWGGDYKTTDTGKEMEAL